MIGVVRLSHARQSFRTFRRPVAAVALGVLAAGSVVACSSGPDQPKSVAEEFASALTSDDVQAAAALTTDPAAASTAISALIDGLGKDEGTFTVSDATFAQIAIYAGELDLPVHIHLHETAQEISDSLAAHGMRPIKRLEKLGLLGPGLIAVHAVHLNDAEIELLARHGCSVAHCPSSNLKLGSGIAPVAGLLQAGVNLGLGTDSAAIVYEYIAELDLLAPTLSDEDQYDDETLWRNACEEDRKSTRLNSSHT